jgi:hypothetical protein
MGRVTCRQARGTHSHRQMDRQRDRQAEREDTDRQSGDLQTVKHTDKQTEKKTLTDRETVDEQRYNNANRQADGW